MARIGRSFFRRPAVEVARDLIGSALVRDDGVRLSGEVVETEAYAGIGDRGSHAYGGRRTARNEALYGEPGRAYVYMIYGLYHCANVSCGDVGDPQCVLLRALRPIEGLEVMAERRGLTKDDDVRKLCGGPSRLCQAFAFDRSCSGMDMCSAELRFLEGSKPDVVASKRIGIDYAGPDSLLPYRFLAKDSAFVSRKA